MPGRAMIGKRPAARLWISLATLLVVGFPSAAWSQTILRVGTAAPEGSRYMKDLRSMSAEIERLTEGQVRFKFFSGGRLGDEKAMGKAVMDPHGKLDGAAFSGVGLSFLVPEMKVWIFPGMFQDYQEVDFIERKYREEYAGYFEKRGLVLVSWGDVGFTYLHSATRLDTYAELKKRHLWLWADDDTAAAALKVLGIITDATSLSGLAERLRAKKIDVWPYPPLAVVGFGLQRHSAFMSDMPFTFLAGAVTVRKDVFDALPVEARRAVLAVGRKWEGRITREWRAENSRAVGAMIKQGTRLVRWATAERERFFQATSAVRGDFARTWGLEALMRRISQDLQLFRQNRQN
jgi:TRAP-type C4-dicarboxylate transport system substrate-binding protein